MSYVTVEVRADDVLEQLDDDELIEELEGRGIKLGPKLDLNEDMEELFYALKYASEGQALEVARRIAQEHTGRIL